MARASGVLREDRNVTQSRRTVGLCLVILALSCLPANAVPIDITSINAGLDTLAAFGLADELGNKPLFPDDSWILSSQIPWGGHIPAPSVYLGGNVVQVSITNMSSRTFSELYYVVDGTFTASNTVITNIDGGIDDLANGFLAFKDAFRIDGVGLNTPLVSESSTADGILEPGETWEFVIQDYNDLIIGTELPGAFGSLGIGAGSIQRPDGDASTASIVAIPEPATFSLVAFGGLLLLRRKR